MSSLEIIRGLIAYNYALHDRLWESINHLRDEQFVMDIPYSHGSVRNHVIHIAGVDGRWLRGLRGEPNACEFQPAPSAYPSLAAAQQLWVSVSADVQGYVATMTEADLITIPSGMEEPRWQILTHIVNHGTDHRAQLLRMLHDFGVPTFDQDLIFYWWARRK
ncbi:MAG: DinB family protein [Caldilineaceae bacterium]|nr:DinB family protein [Caldilineaceae bacterium]